MNIFMFLCVSARDLVIILNDIDLLFGNAPIRLIEDIDSNAFTGIYKQPQTRLVK